MPRLSRGARRSSLVDTVQNETSEKPAAKAASKKPARKQQIVPRRRRRRDPTATKHIDGSAEWSKLRNADPNVKYVFASLETQNAANPTSVRYYEDLGYQVIRADEGGTALGAGCVTAEEGAPIEMMGTVLMGIHVDDAADIKKYGPSGNTGLELYDEIEKKILSKGGVDPLRGRELKHLRQETDTQPLEVEV